MASWDIGAVQREGGATDIGAVQAAAAAAIPGWIGINSSHLDSQCGEEVGNTLADALDGTDWWEHAATETHEFIVDLGQTYNVQKVRGRSNSGFDPTNVNIYVSTDKVNWAAAVYSGIDTWQDTAEWQEVDTTDKNGRYVKVEIVTTEDVLDNYILFGAGAPFTIFDVYADEAVPIVGNPGMMTTNAGFWGPTY